MISPELVRRICWQPPEGAVHETLIALGARRWQAEIAAPILEQALTEREPLEIAEPAAEAEGAVEE
jgi:ribonuclease D